MPSDVEKSSHCDHKEILGINTFVLMPTNDIKYKDLPASLREKFSEECLKKFKNPPALMILQCPKCKMCLTYHLNAIWWSSTSEMGKTK